MNIISNKRFYLVPECIALVHTVLMPGVLHRSGPFATSGALVHTGEIAARYGATWRYTWRHVITQVKKAFWSRRRLGREGRRNEGRVGMVGQEEGGVGGEE